MRKASKGIKRFNHFGKKLRPKAIIKGAWKKSHTLKNNVTHYVILHPLKTSGYVALGLVAVSGAVFGYLKRK